MIKSFLSEEKRTTSMKRRQPSEKMLKRFKVMDDFAKSHGRLPTNQEVASMFNLRTLGGTTWEVIQKYKKSKTHCTCCEKKL